MCNAINHHNLNLQVIIRLTLHAYIRIWVINFSNLITVYLFVQEFFRSDFGFLGYFSNNFVVFNLYRSSRVYFSRKILQLYNWSTSLLSLLYQLMLINKLSLFGSLEFTINYHELL